MNSKIRVSTEIGVIWWRDEYREFLKKLALNPDIELFIISDDIYHLYYPNIRTQIPVTEVNTIVCTLPGQKLQAIIDNNIQIHFDNLEGNVIDINNNTTCTAILVDYNQDRYKVQMKYAEDFDRELAIILDKPII